MGMLEQVFGGGMPFLTPSGNLFSGPVVEFPYRSHYTTATHN